VFLKAPPEDGRTCRADWFFSKVNIHAQSADLTVNLRDIINGLSVLGRDYSSDCDLILLP